MDYNHTAERRYLNQPSNPTSDQAAHDPGRLPLQDIELPYTPLPPASAPMDVEMRDHDMTSQSDSESVRDALEVEMHTVAGEDLEDPPLPEIETAVPASRPNNRRARVEDDEDDERDRRHPSQRIIYPIASSSTLPSTPRPARTPASSSTRDPLLAEHSTHSTPLNSSSTSTPLPSRPQSMDSTPLTQQQPRQPQAVPSGRLPPFLSGGFAISIDFPFGPNPTISNISSIPPGGVPGAPPAPPNVPASDQPQPANPPEGAPPRMPEGGMGFPPALFEMLSNPNFMSDMLGIEPDVDDPERADRLLAGLEEVPVGLVRRLERVGGMAGAASGDELGGGDSGCAVCWEKLLEVEEEDNSGESDSKAKQKEPEKENQDEKKPYPKIVSLPCAHVFHSECLRPWFSRPKQTTCPTCRFNIDPENLTYVPYRQRQRAQQDAASSSSANRPSTSTTGNNNATTHETSATTPPARPSSSEPAPTPVPTSEELPRGRSSSPPTSVPPRRAGSEPPSNRASRPALPESLIQSFPIPGGHVVLVSQPIGFITDAQGRPVAERTATNAAQQATPGDARSQAQTQPTASPAGSNPSATTPPTGSAPASEPRPVFGPPPPPEMGPGARRVPGMPDGVIAFDFHFGPAPPGFLFGQGPRRPQPQQQQGEDQAQSQSRPQPQVHAQQDPPQPQQRPQVPPLRVPGGLFGPGFAGVNFGPRQGGETGMPNFMDLLRSFSFLGPPPGAPGNQPAANPANAPQPAQAAPPSQGPQPEPETETTPTPSANPAEAVPTPAPATSPSADNTDPSTPPPPSPGNAGEFTEGDAAFLRFLTSALGNPSALLRLILAAGLMGRAGGEPGLGFRHDSQPPRETVKKEWTPPPAPGPTLRQRVERREHEAGLRCSDVSCGIGPSDDDPFVSLEQSATKQHSIHLAGDVSKPVCSHAFHSACLVSAERVALRGAEASIVGDDVEVSCPVCRGVGCFSKNDWDEGVQTLL